MTLPEPDVVGPGIADVLVIFDKPGPRERRPDQGGAPVSGLIVDQDDLDAQAGQGLLERGETCRKVGAVIVVNYYDRELRLMPRRTGHHLHRFLISPMRRAGSRAAPIQGNSGLRLSHLARGTARVFFAG